MLGGLGDLANLVKSAKQMQDKMNEVQASLAKMRHEGVAGGEMVKAVVDGRGTLVDIKIDPSAVSDVELLEDLIKSAVAAAVVKSAEAMKQEMAQVTGGLNIPGLGDMLGGGS